MKCPDDGSTLANQTYETIQIEECPSCRGVWLDTGELERIQEAREEDHSEALANPPDRGLRAYLVAPTLRILADLVTHQTEGIAPLIGVTDGDERLRELEGRLRAALTPKWNEAQRLGTVGSHATLNDLMMAIAMVAAVVMHAAEPDRHAVATAAWELLRPGLTRSV